MTGNDLFYIFHATIADFDGRSIDDFVELVRWGEVFVYYCQEFLSNVGSDIFAVWGIEPGDFSFSFSIVVSVTVVSGTIVDVVAGISVLWGLVLQLIVVSTIDQGSLV